MDIPYSRNLGTHLRLQQNWSGSYICACPCRLLSFEPWTYGHALLLIKGFIILALIIVGPSSDPQPVRYIVCKVTKPTACVDQLIEQIEVRLDAVISALALYTYSTKINHVVFKKRWSHYNVIRSPEPFQLCHLHTYGHRQYKRLIIDRDCAKILVIARLNGCENTLQSPPPPQSFCRPSGVSLHLQQIWMPKVNAKRHKCLKCI